MMSVIYTARVLAEALDVRSLPSTDATPGAVSTLVSVVFGITASIAVLIIVIGGFRYIVAHGDPNSVAQARKSILYAIIGLFVTLAAYSIVQFVVRGTA